MNMHLHGVSGMGVEAISGEALVGKVDAFTISMRRAIYLCFT